MTERVGAGRVTAEIFQPYGFERWRTTTAYGGDRVDVTPPAGGTATSTVTDARGRTVQLRQYHGPAPTPHTAGSWDATTYTFDRRGFQTKITDTLGNDWTYTYDTRGRQIEVDDPDRGTTSYTYDNAGNILTTTDARGEKIAYVYDPLGRKRAAGVDRARGQYRHLEWCISACEYDTIDMIWNACALGLVECSNDYTRRVHVDRSLQFCIDVSCGYRDVGSASGIRAKNAYKHLKKSQRCDGENSFSGDTEVLMADGTTKKFDELKIGDEVLATDPETGEQGPRKIAAVWVHDDHLYQLTIDGQPVTTTEDHPAAALNTGLGRRPVARARGPASAGPS